MEWLVSLVSGFVGILVGLIPWNPGRVRGSLSELQTRYRGSTVRRVEFPPESDSRDGTVEFVVADRSGLSFRDGHGGELLKVPNDAIDHLAKLPGDGSLGYGYVAVRVGGVPLATFWSADDIAADLLAALRR